MTFKLADALAWLMAARMQILDTVRLAEDGGAALGDALPGTVQFFSDLCRVQSARAAGEVGRICAELVHGYVRHPAWDEEGRRACWSAVEMAARVTKEKVVYLLDPLGASRRSAALRAADAALRAARFAFRWDEEAVELPWTPAFLHKQDGFVFSMGQLMQWMSAQVLATGTVSAARTSMPGR